MLIEFLRGHLEHHEGAGGCSRAGLLQGVSFSK